MKKEPRLVFKGATGLCVYEYGDYKIFVGVLSRSPELPGYYPTIVYNKQGEDWGTSLDPTLTFTVQEGVIRLMRLLTLA